MEGMSISYPPAWLPLPLAFKLADIRRGEPYVRPDLLLAVSIGISLETGEQKVRPYVRMKEKGLPASSCLLLT